MFLKVVRAFVFLQIGLLIAGFTAFSQTPSSDTLKLTIKQAEDRFLNYNLRVVIQRYNIGMADAQVITARLFPNPDFSFNNGLHTNDASEGPAYKDQSFSVSQLFTTAGKRNKNIQLAKIGVEQSRDQLFDLLRTLRYSLRNDFYSIYFHEQSAKVYSDEISSLSKTLGIFKDQYTKGNVAKKEVLRIQSQLYTLQAEYNNLQVGIDTVQSELKMLIKAGPAVYIQPLYNYDLEGKNVLENVPYQTLLDSAYTNRYDLKLAKINVDYNKANLQLQKADAVPDLSLSLNYDKYGGYGTNFLGAGIGFSLPFFNRNQGAIKQAAIAIGQSSAQLQNQQDQVESDLATGYKGALRLEKLYNGFDPAFKENFNLLIQEVFKNYEKRNIGLLEFLDFYDSYKTNTLQLNALELSRVASLEQLNYLTGTPFFNK